LKNHTRFFSVSGTKFLLRKPLGFIKAGLDAAQVGSGKGIDIPGEEKLDAGAEGFLTGILDDAFNIRAAAIFLKRQFNFTGEDYDLIFIKEGKVAAF